MDFLTICKTVRLLSGMQGSGPSSVVNSTGVDQVIIRMVQDVYKDIQNMREEWPWLTKTQTFSTTFGKYQYTLDDIFSSITNDLKDYKKNSFVITSGTKQYMKEIGEEVMEYSYLNSEAQGLPQTYSIKYNDYSLELRDIPDASYSISFSYYQLPQELAKDNDVPLMPPAYHDLIVYKALERLSVYLSSAEIYTQYKMETSKMEGRLLRGTLKPIRVKTRPLA